MLGLNPHAGISGTTMDISFTFAAFCMSVIQPVTDHWPLVTYTVKWAGYLPPLTFSCDPFHKNTTYAFETLIRSFGSRIFRGKLRVDRLKGNKKGTV